MDLLPPGLHYFSNFVTDDYTKKIDELPWVSVHKDYAGSRRVQHYGYYYNYDRSDTFRVAPEMPSFIMDIKENIMKKCIELGLTEIYPNLKFDQCIVNNYYPGQGISYHTDHYKFGPVIACITFNSGSLMSFMLPQQGEKDKIVYDLFTEPGSVYIMTGAVRSNFLHKMDARKNDVVDGVKIPRGRRISVTFRQVNQ